MKTRDAIKVLMWLDECSRGCNLSDLKSTIEREFGKIESRIQIGYGEGVVILNVGEFTACSSETSEALMELAMKLIEGKQQDTCEHSCNSGPIMGYHVCDKCGKVMP